MAVAVTDLRGLPLLDYAIDWITQHPETWVQETYRCKSGMCLAGWICELTGATWVAGYSRNDELSECVIAEPDDNLPGMSAIHCSDRAARLIGHPDVEDCDDTLFAGGNTLDGIRSYRDELASYLASTQEG